MRAESTLAWVLLLRGAAGRADAPVDGLAGACRTIVLDRKALARAGRAPADEPDCRAALEGHVAANLGVSTTTGDCHCSWGRKGGDNSSGGLAGSS